MNQEDTMTPEPRNEAAERLLDLLLDDTKMRNGYDDKLRAIKAALAAERAAPKVDVERLPDFIRDKIESEPYQGLHPELASMGLAVALRDEWPEYARLAGEEER